VGKLGDGSRVRQKRQRNALSHTTTDRFGRRERALSDRENRSRSGDVDMSEQHTGAGRQMAARANLAGTRQSLVLTEAEQNRLSSAKKTSRLKRRCYSNKHINIAFATVAPAPPARVFRALIPY
jgi:hypothetical protein